VPMVMDVATRKARPLAAELAEAHYVRIGFSASGARAAVLRGLNEVLEVDVAKGKVIRQLDAGNDAISGVTYSGEELLITRSTWVGDVWIADLP
jgi:hypothetical protein